MTYLFWFSIVFILFAYAGYPFLLWLITRFYHRRPSHGTEISDAFSPAVTLIISAHNEEKSIEEKILNSLALDYPKELLEIIVVSDGSRDKTDLIVHRYADKGVVLKKFKDQMGKTACLNETVPFVTGEIVVFSDANSLYVGHAIWELIRHFSDKRVGFVTGMTKYISESGNGVVSTIGIYSKIEKITKMLETNLSSCVGADGAIFSIRKNLFQTLGSADINDLVIPLNIIKKGFRGVFEEKAYCFEKTAKDVRGEFRRQVRITVRTIRALFRNRELFNPLQYKIFSFQIICHKLCKLSVPFFLVTMLLSNIVIMLKGYVYILTFIGQLLLYILALLGNTHRQIKGLSTAISISETFVSINAAILLGWVKLLKGETYTTWTTERSQEVPLNVDKK